MFACSLDALCGFGTAIGTNHLLGTLVDTGGFLQEFSTFPVMGFGLLQTAFITLAVMLIVHGFLPFAVRMLTCILNTGLAAIIIDLFASVGFLIALATDLVFLVRMFRFRLSVVVVAATGVAGTTGTAAGIVGRTEIEIADLALTDHNAMSIIAVSTGVTLNRIEIRAFCVINKTHMAKSLFKEQVAFLRSVVLTVFVG